MASTQNSAEILAEKQNAEQSANLDSLNSQNSVILTTDNQKSSCEIYFQGATVTSWKVDGQERIFTSSKAIFDSPDKAIRGGIPLVFPNFGPWELGPQHGFARICRWKLVKKCDRSATFELTENEKSLAMWPNKFKLHYTVKVTNNKLLTTMQVTNNNQTDEFDFTLLLHTYLRTKSILHSEIFGFEGTTVTDSLNQNQESVESDQPIKINCNVDRVYRNTKDEHILVLPKQDPLSETEKATQISIRKTNLPDTVLWNPWAEKAAAMKDFDDNEYHEMVCIEAGYVSDRKILKPGETYFCEQVLEEMVEIDENANEDSYENGNGGCEYFGNFAKKD